MDKKLELYESLARLSFIPVFAVALAVGTFGLIYIAQMLMLRDVPSRHLNYHSLASAEKTKPN